MRLSAGNENEQRHLLPLVDELAARGIRPDELWADRGYASQAIEQGLLEREIEPRISKPRKKGEPIPAGTPVREVWRGKKRRLKTPDPQARQRWPVERTNAWLKARRPGRTHQRLAESETTDRHPPRPQPRHLPRLPPARDDPHPHQVILRSAPVPITGPSGCHSLRISLVRVG